MIGYGDEFAAACRSRLRHRGDASAPVSPRCMHLKTPRSCLAHIRFSARTERAFASVRKSRRIRAGRTARGFSIQAAIRFSKYGPIPANDVSDSPAVAISHASRGQRKAFRAARRKARCKFPDSVFASRASNSVISLLNSLIAPRLLPISSRPSAASQSGFVAMPACLATVPIRDGENRRTYLPAAELY